MKRTSDHSFSLALWIPHIGRSFQYTFVHTLTRLCLISIVGTNELAVVDRLSPTRAFVSYEPSRSEQKSGISGQFIVQYDVDRSEDAGDLIVSGSTVKLFHIRSKINPNNLK